MAGRALLCPGQGAQFVGMGKDVAEASPASRALWDAANEAMGRDLASICFEGPDDELTRFKTEAEVIARFQHPNLIQIYEVGSADGCLFLALEFVEGGTLDDQLDGTPWPSNSASKCSSAAPKPTVTRSDRPSNAPPSRG